MSWFGWGGGKDDNKGGTSAGGSGNSRSRNPGGTTKSSSTLPVPGLDFSIPSDLGGEIDIDSIQFNDAELNDPSLLVGFEWNGMDRRVSVVLETNFNFPDSPSLPLPLKHVISTRQSFLFFSNRPN